MESQWSQRNTGIGHCRCCNDEYAYGVRCTAVFSGGCLTLSDQDGVQCQVGYVVGLRYFSIGKGAKEVRDWWLETMGNSVI
jgi:hypothetical protein